MRDLSEKMKEVLMDCHERLLMRQEPRSTYYARYCKGLITRGLVTVKPFCREGKELMGLYITEKGKAYLKDSGMDPVPTLGN